MDNQVLLTVFDMSSVASCPVRRANTTPGKESDYHISLNFSSLTSNNFVLLRFYELNVPFFSHSETSILKSSEYPNFTWNLEVWKSESSLSVSPFLSLCVCLSLHTHLPPTQRGDK